MMMVMMIATTFPVPSSGLSDVSAVSDPTRIAIWEEVLLSFLLYKLEDKLLNLIFLPDLNDTLKVT
jgi:hypothetical protein